MASFISDEKVLRYFTINILILILIGIVMVFSASYLYASEYFNNPYFFLIKHLSFVVLGIFSILILRKIKFSFCYNNNLIFLLLGVITLSLTIIPQFGVKLKGASRWIDLGIFNFQPAEYLKYILILSSIFFFENFYKLSFRKRMLYFSSFLSLLVILLIQPDFGAFSIYILIIAFCCYLSSFPRKYFLSLLFIAPVVGVSLMFIAPYRVQRLLAYLDPWKDPLKSGFQIIQSYLALVNGFIWGKGVGNSDAKLFYLPEAHNDFIFSVIGEEFGFIGIFFVVLAFISFIYLGFRLSLLSDNKISMIFICSVIFTIGIQAFLNMGVVLGLLPTKGLNLPFVSYGGSSLLSNCIAIGLVFSSLQKSYRITS